MMVKGFERSIVVESRVLLWSEGVESLVGREGTMLVGGVKKWWG